MGRTTTFFEFTPVTKARWERRARQACALAHYESGADNDHVWSKDQVVGHIREVIEDEGNEIDERRPTMYLERLRMASVFSGPDVPTLDLVALEEGGFAYRWIRDGEIPAGFLSHILGVAGAMPRLAFDYFVLMGQDYRLDELVSAIGPGKAMTLLLMAELYVRVHRADELSNEGLDHYLDLIAQFKSELQEKMTDAQRQAFNELTSGLLLPGPA